MDRLMSLAARHKLWVIEDCAEAHGAKVGKKVVGSFGDLACFSFYANKILTTGEGGMVLTNNDMFAQKLGLLRNLGFQKPRFYHDVAGFNFRMTGYQAAMGLAQLRKLERIIEKKRAVASYYYTYLRNIPDIRLPKEPLCGRHVHWMYGVLLNRSMDGAYRDRLAGRLADMDIETRTFFCPMNIQPCLKDVAGYRSISCPVAEYLWTHGLYLPSSPHLSEGDVRTISETFRRALEETHC